MTGKKANGYFKVICGAGNENLTEIKRLSMVYTLAGADIIDVSATVNSVQAAAEGIDAAKIFAERWDLQLTTVPVIMISVNASDDPHFRKAVINSDLCYGCGECISMCEQDAISQGDTILIIPEKCIGCGKCTNECEIAGAITFVNTNPIMVGKIKDCINAGAEAIELHASTPDDDMVLSKLKDISKSVLCLPISLCVDRSCMSDKQIISRISAAYNIVGERMIVQADGVPMSGGLNDYHTTLQAIATADIILKSKIPVKVLVSGGTNDKTRNLADLCGVDIGGIAIGSFARKIVRRCIVMDEFDTDKDLVMKAVTAAGKLVIQSTGGL